jgi:hypothetical protein
MKTFSFYATYHYEDSGEVEAESYEEAVEQIQSEMAYVVAPAGFSVGWDWVDIHECDEIDDDGEDDEDD